MRGESMPIRRGVGIVALGCLTVLLLSGCTPPDKIAVRVNSSDKTLEIAPCEEIAVNLVRVEQFDAASAEWTLAWIAVGDHQFDAGDQLVVRQPIEGMEVRVDRPLDFGDDSTIAVSLERWPESALEDAIGTDPPQGVVISALGLTFKVSELGEQWHRADHSSHELPCG